MNASEGQGRCCPATADRTLLHIHVQRDQALRLSSGQCLKAGPEQPERGTALREAFAGLECAVYELQRPGADAMQGPSLLTLTVPARQDIESQESSFQRAKRPGLKPGMCNAQRSMACVFQGQMSPSASSLILVSQNSKRLLARASERCKGLDGVGASPTVGPRRSDLSETGPQLPGMGPNLSSLNATGHRRWAAQKPHLPSGVSEMVKFHINIETYDDCDNGAPFTGGKKGLE
ncbi:hypothetical protein TREES_T100004165 [Tupaia chinensis]|uniref:Uncharacterized protein n=1 Tax=Tupaia chinensis TaxID=246437 RepID=L9KIA1_TUPCH|nr:hypothetical protein TREES_T100004165 [Tupaia chinensis]